VLLLTREVKKAERNIMSKRQNEGKNLIRTNNKMMGQNSVRETEVMKQ